MRRFFYQIILPCLVLFICTSWGFYAHYRINRLAVFTLPKGMAAFYQANITFITQHAVSPDKLRYVDSAEIPHHFFDADRYGRDPFHTVPQKWNDAAKKYTPDTLFKYGTLPWTIQYHYYKLVNAFKRHDTTAILHHSAYIGHYIADASVPLHLTQNYDGQLTGQAGLHALWESRLPELLGNSYHYYAGQAHYIENPLWQSFIICRSSYKCIDSVLRLEKQLNKTFAPELKMSRQQRGNRKVTDYSPQYCKAYNNLLKGMVQRRLRMAINNVGSFWFSAWVDAGQPNLNKLIATPPSPDEKVQLAKEAAMYKAGKVIDIESLPALKQSSKPIKPSTLADSTNRRTAGKIL